jgi:hypothetical protein
MKIISNTTVLILLGKIFRYDLLENLYSEILIPAEVERELLFKNCPEQIYIKKFLDRFIKVKEVKKVIPFPLDTGEQHAISLAKEMKGMLLTDDEQARTIAEIEDIPVKGTVGIILQNVEKKKCTGKEGIELLQELLRKGMYLSTEIYAEAERLIADLG